MSKYGKYEKRPEAVAPKQPQVKSLLLQTYFTSLLSLVLCVSMFFGTSYAWFTSEVASTENEIYIGTLKVGLYKQTEEWNNEKRQIETVWKDLAKAENKLFDDKIRWEPGYTALETIKIVNEGDLAFKYVLSFTDGTVTGPENSGKNLSDIAQHFEISVYPGETPVIESYAAIGENEDWISRKTLDKVLSGKSILEGDVKNGTEAVAESAEAGEDAKAENEGIYTIALHMKEDADASVMGHRIKLNVKLVAYQMTHETDDTGSAAYDDVLAVSDVADLKNTQSGKNDILLTSGIVFQNPEDCITMAGGSLDGNGTTVVYSGEKVSEKEYANVITASGGAISNLTVNGGTSARALYTANLEEDLFVSNCVLSGVYAFNLASDGDLKNTGHTINFTDTVFNSFTVFENRMEHAYFTDCTFNELLKPHGDTTLTNCVITNNFLVLSDLKAGETVTLAHCTYNGTKDVNVVITNVDGQIVTEGNVAFTELDSGKYGISSNS